MSDEAVELGMRHGAAAKEFADALRAADEAGERLLQLSRDAAEQEYPDTEDFERPVEVYERARATLLQAEGTLAQEKAADPRPLCTACLKRLYPDQVKNTCSAQNFRRAHRLEEPA